MQLDLMMASEWSAEMTATLMTYGYCPVIVVGAKLGDGPNDLGFAVSCAPGMDDRMIREVLADLVNQHDRGTTRWSKTPPELQHKNGNGPVPH